MCPRYCPVITCDTSRKIYFDENFFLHLFCQQGCRGSQKSQVHCRQKGHHHWGQEVILGNIGSGNGLVPAGTKPFPEPMLTYHQLDESTARRQLKSPQSLSGRSIHLTLVTKWSWSWSWMTHCHLLCAMSIGPPILRYSYFKIWPWKSMVKVMYVVKAQGHI